MPDPVRPWSFVVLGIAVIAVTTVIIVKQTGTSVPVNQLVMGSGGSVKPVPATIDGSIPAHCYPACSDYDLAVLRSIPNQIQLTPDLHEVQLTKFREWAAALDDKKASESYLFWIDDMMRKRGEEKDREQRVLEHIPNIPKAICRDRYEGVPHDPPDGSHGQFRIVTECLTISPAVKP
jgi:hypothetical protein